MGCKVFQDVDGDCALEVRLRRPAHTSCSCERKRVHLLRRSQERNGIEQITLCQMWTKVRAALPDSFRSHSFPASSSSSRVLSVSGRRTVGDEDDTHADTESGAHRLQRITLPEHASPKITSYRRISLVQRHRFRFRPKCA